jgi:lipopolysaccharide export system protein LptA
MSMPTVTPLRLVPAAVLALGLACAGPAAGQLLPGLGGDENDSPVQIEATESLEWHSEEQTYVARGDAVLRQDEIEVRGDVLTAFYRELESGGTEIWRAAAEGNVVIEAPEGRAESDRAVYDLDQDVIVLTGGDLRLESSDGTLTATDTLEYYPSDQLAVARGDALVERTTGDRVRGDVLTGEFVEDEEGSLQLSIVSAFGNVRIDTDTDVATAEHGVYDLGTNVAILEGSVRLVRGDNQLSGDLAEVNLDTGMSRLIANPTGEGPIRALLVPNQ